MALLQDELKITNMQELLGMKLALPSYQRPYRWSAKSTNTLFNDTYNAYQEGIEEYRMGSIILHKENEIYNIVDGQQRLTTIAILLYCLGEENQSLLREKYNELSNDAIVMNFELLSKRVRELSNDEQEKYKEYLLNNCTTVRIVTDREQEAFQFFDSQNSRGKALKPHDLLKSYHLREMNDEDEHQKVKIISQWESINERKLNDLFTTYLYPLKLWYKGKSGLGYSSNKIDIFKGIKSTNVYNYALYHKASNLFVEQFNASGSGELLATKTLNQFQLTQPLIAGKRFFYYTFHYRNLLLEIRKLIDKFHNDDQVPNKRTGDKYIKQLYESSLLFFADRFGLESITESVMKQLYTWSYSLRLSMVAIYPETINNYARKGHERINKGLDMFTKISEMSDADELKLIVLEKPKIIGDNENKYKLVYEKLSEWNGW